jgi:hypothetical protein
MSAKTPKVRCNHCGTTQYYKGQLRCKKCNKGGRLELLQRRAK